jgi:hypothetical protein
MRPFLVNQLFAKYLFDSSLSFYPTIRLDIHFAISTTADEAVDAMNCSNELRLKGQQ